MLARFVVALEVRAVATHAGGEADGVGRGPCAARDAVRVRKNPLDLAGVLAVERQAAKYAGAMVRTCSRSGTG